MGYLDMAIDITSDKQYKVLSRLRARVEFPEFSKEASVNEQDLGDLPSHCFAWPEKRAFPIDSKANAYMSHAYFLATAKSGSAVPDHVFDNLEKAACIFSLEGDLQKLAGTLKRASTPTAKTSDFGLMYKQAGKVVCKYPLLNGDQVKQAAAHFETNHATYPVEHQRMIADNILLKAAKFNVAVHHPSVFQCAGCSSQIDVPAAVEELHKRASRNKGTTFGPAFEKIAEALSSVKKHDIDSVRRLQDLTYQLDKQAGIDKYYGRYYKNPLKFMYSDNEVDYLFKHAEEMVSLGGDQVPLTSLLALSPQMYEDILGKDSHRELMIGDQLDPNKVKMVIPTLPRPEAIFLQEQLRAAGLFS